MFSKTKNEPVPGTFQGFAKPRFGILLNQETAHQLASGTLWGTVLEDVCHGHSRLSLRESFFFISRRAVMFLIRGLYPEVSVGLAPTGPTTDELPQKHALSGVLFPVWVLPISSAVPKPETKQNLYGETFVASQLWIPPGQARRKSVIFGRQINTASKRKATRRQVTYPFVREGDPWSRNVDVPHHVNRLHPKAFLPQSSMKQTEEIRSGAVCDGDRRHPRNARRGSSRCSYPALPRPRVGRKPRLAS
jgi:hypothetical protein